MANSSMELLRSTSLLVRGVIKRFYLWAPVVVLDPFDLYDKLIKPLLPEGWKFDLPWSPDWAPLVLIALIVWAALLTFHELRLRPTIRPTIWPNWREEDVVTYLLGKSKFMRGRLAEDGLIDEIELALRDMARRGAIHSWGRPWREDGASVSRTEKPIPEENWDTDHFNIFDGVGTDGNKSLRRRINIYGTKNYGNVKFNKNEIVKEWPRAMWFSRLLDIRRWARIRLTKGERVKDGKG